MQIFSLVLSNILLMVHSFSVKVQHSFDGQTFQPAGIISGDIHGYHGGQLAFVRQIHSSQEIESFNAAIANDGLYYLKVPSNPDNLSSSSVVAAIPAASLSQNGLQELIDLQISPSGDITAINYGTSQRQILHNSILASALAGKSSQDTPNKLDNLNFVSQVTYSIPTTAHHISIDEMIQASSQAAPGSQQPGEQSAQGKGAQKQQEQPNDILAFLKKNWMFIVIAMWVMSIIRNIGQQMEGQQQQQQGGRR